MKTTFDLGGHTLIIGGQYQQASPDACGAAVDLGKVVPIQVIHHPLPRFGKKCAKCGAEWTGPGNTPDYCPNPQCQTHFLGEAGSIPTQDETVLWVQLEPSHARAVASALLACATQVQRQ